MKFIVLAAIHSSGMLVAAQDFPLALENRHSGISLELSGANGVDWAVELGDHDPSIAEQTLYLRGSVELSLAHNDRNALTIDVAGKARVLGTTGWDGMADSGDEGDIYYKVDRDLQAHRYSTKSGALPGHCVRYQTPFRFDALTYDGTQPVLGAVGDNGVAWGGTPKGTTARFAYGQRDEFGNDFLNELGQTLQQFADAGVAYDLMAAHFRTTNHPEGMTPIEELRIREGLAKIAKTILQMRSNWSATSGAGDTHWSHGYELAIGMIALAMPTYRSALYGVSGGDRISRNTSPAVDGTFWNPFPNQGVTWYEAATDPAIATPGHPNVRYPFRAEFLLTDDGWWTGPNDLVADGDRYFTGPAGRRLADVKSSGLANAECRVELVEMSGYESPFVARLHVFDHARRLRGYDNPAPGVTAYIRRRLLGGWVPLAWDGGSKTYAAQPPRFTSSLLACNPRYPFAALAGPRGHVVDFLNLLTYLRTVPQVPRASGGTPLWWLHVHGLLAGATPDEAESHDVDRDGHSALAEYIAGTDPNSAASRLAVLPSAVREGGFTLGWNGVAGRSYAVQRNLSFPRPEGWATIAEPLPAAFDLSMQYSDANASDHVRACYRVAVRMP